MCSCKISPHLASRAGRNIKNISEDMKLLEQMGLLASEHVKNRMAPQVETFEKLPISKELEL